MASYQTNNTPTSAALSDAGDTVHLSYEDENSDEFQLPSPFTPTDYKTMALEIAYLTPRRKGSSSSTKTGSNNTFSDPEERYFFQGPEVGEKNRLLNSPQKVRQ